MIDGFYSQYHYIHRAQRLQNVVQKNCGKFSEARICRSGKVSTRSVEEARQRTRQAGARARNQGLRAAARAAVGCPLVQVGRSGALSTRM